MPFADQSTPDPSQGGLILRNKMLATGAPQPQVDDYMTGLRQKMLATGAPQDQVDNYFGIQKPSAEPMATALGAEVEPHAHTADNPWESMIAGWQGGNLGIAATSGKPSVVPNPNAGPLDAVMETAGAEASDLPTQLDGALAGAIAGIAGGPAGMVRGAMYGAAMVPPAVRSALIAHYNSDGPYTAGGVFKNTLAAASEGAKAGVGVVVGEGVGSAVTTAANKLGMDAAITKLTGMLSGGAATTETQSILNGKPIPSANDFITGMVQILGTEAGIHVAGGFKPSAHGTEVIQNLQDIYAKDGLTPDEVTHLMGQDEAVRQEVLRSRTPAGDLLTPQLDTYAAQLGRQTPKDYGPAPKSPYEPEKVEPVPLAPLPGVEPEPVPGFMKPEQVPEKVMATFKTLEGSADDAISPAGAIGRYQIMPGTARQYGFDPALLKDPAYNERAARAILADLNNRFKGNLADMAVAYNAGPGRAEAWIKGGRDLHSLPLETQKYLLHAERIGAIDEGFTATAGRAALATDPAVADAPELSSGFKEPPPPTEPPAGGEPPPEEPAGPLSKEDADAAFAKQIGQIDAPKGWASRINPGAIWRGFQFALTPAHNLDKVMNLEAGEAGTEDALRASLGTKGQSDQIYGTGPIRLTFDPNGRPIFTNTVGANFEDAYRVVTQAGGNLTDFTNYRLAKRTLDEDAKGRKTGFPVEAAKVIVNYPGSAAKYDPAMKIIAAAERGVNEYSLAAGTLGKDNLDRMEAAVKNYVPLNRILDKNYTPPNWGKFFGIKSPYYQTEGSARQVVPPIVAEMDNLNLRVRMATRNAAVKFTIDQMAKNDPNSVQLATLSKNSIAKAAQSALDEMTDDHGEPLSGEAKEAARPLAEAKAAQDLMKSTQAKNADNSVTIFRDGKPETWVIKDPEIAKMIKGTGGGPGDPVVEAVGALNRLTTSGIVTAPAFVPRALWHAAITQPVFGEGGSHIPFGNYYHGTIAALMGDKAGGFYKDAYERYAANGGLGGTYNEVERNFIEPRILKIMRGEGDTKTPVLSNFYKNPLDLLRVIQHMAHTSGQVGGMIASEQKGMSTLRAAQLARKAGFDYAEPFQGGAQRVAANFIPLWSTGFKDIQQVSQAFADHPMATAIKGIAGLTMPAILLAAMNRMQDNQLDPKDRYTNIPKYITDANFVFPMINGKRFMLPIPYVAGPIFASMPARLFNMAWDEAHGDSKQAGADMEGWVQGMIDRMAPNFIPPLIEAPVEAASNYSFYLNRPLVPASQQSKSGYLQYGANTTKVSIAVANFLRQLPAGPSWSPTIIDNYVQVWGGSLPMQLWRSAGDTTAWVAKRIGNAPATGEAPADWTHNPFVKSFFVQNTGIGQAGNDFYDRLAEVTRAKADLKDAEKKGDTVAMQKDAANPLLGVNMVGVAKSLANMRTFVDQINASNMTDEEKLHQTNDVMNQAYSLAKGTVDMVDKLKQQSQP